MRNTHGIEVAVGLYVTTATRAGVVQSIEAKQGLRQAFFFEDGTTELVNNVTLSEEFEITSKAGRWELSCPWQLQAYDQDFPSLMDAKRYLRDMHPYAKPKLVAAAKPLPRHIPRQPSAPVEGFDDMDDDLPF